MQHQPRGSHQRPATKGISKPQLGTVIALSAASGAGKSTTLQYLWRAYGIRPSSKYSDRLPRPDQLPIPGETLPVTQEAYEQLRLLPSAIEYRYGDHRILLIGDEIAAQVAHQGAAIIGISKWEPTDELAQHLAGIATVVPIYIDIEPRVIDQRLRAAGYDDISLRDRTERSHQCEEQYRAHPDRYYILDNNHDWLWLESQLHELMQALNIPRIEVAQEAVSV